MQVNESHDQKLKAALCDDAAVNAAECKSAHPPSPLDVVIVSESDEADWISFPPFFAHVVCILSEEGSQSYGMRMRGSNGKLTLLHGPEQNLENVRRHVEIRWLYFLNDCLRPTRYGEEDVAADLYRELGRMESIACPVPPPGSRSPFTPIVLNKNDEIDFHRFPVGYPFVVEAKNDYGIPITGSLIRNASLEFEDFQRIAIYHGPGQPLIEWMLTLEADKLARTAPIYGMIVHDFHREHCESRGIKPATYPSDELPAAAYR